MLEKLDVHLVGHVSQVLELALEPEPVWNLEAVLAAWSELR
ncbi:MAG TPA: hypothetical protein VLR26_04850 [Frankiaceae bacterium]|nr:hypothetical protein [Frankiaceae bacterium]